MKRITNSGGGHMHDVFCFGALKLLMMIVMVAMGSSVARAQESPSNSEEASSDFKFVRVTKRWKSLRKPYAVIATKDSRQLYFSGYENGGIGIFERNVETGAITNQAVLDGRPGMIHLDLSADETRAVGCSYTEGLYLFDRSVTNGSLKERFHLPNDASDEDSLSRPISLVLSPDGRFAYVTDEERHALYVFEVTKDNEFNFVQKHDGLDDCLQGARLITTDSAGEKLFVTASKKGTLTVFDRDPTAGHVRMLGYAIDGKDDVSRLAGAHGVAISPDDRFVYVACGRFEGHQSICVFELLDEGKLKLVQQWEPTLSHPFSGGSHIGVSPDGKHVIATAWDTKNIAHFLREPETGEITFHEFCQFKGKVDVGRTTQPYFSPDGNFFYLGSASGNVLTYGKNNNAKQQTETEIDRGVSFELATQRHATITNVEYDLSLELKKKDPIPASIKIRFELSDTTKPVVLDFSAPSANVESVSINLPNSESLNKSEFTVKNGHITVPVSHLKPGTYEITARFIAGDQSLNRNEEFLYTLLVPDRASTVFPCFDQPDLKAKFKLDLKLPEGWIASANGVVDSVIETAAKPDGTAASKTFRYRQTKPISTYLFAFAAGEFKQITREIAGRKVTMLHRESDAEKVERNVDAIFKIHEFSLDWMETYTKIDYPFDKFDFVLIPSFQYGGMEHIGNIFYNADQLFLEESATKDQKLRRASLIAHETAHMWFGNLVTMKWFDDVWLKEVFANFMAAKIVHPTFPEINHDLGFMLKHHPSAYGEDRTGGTYPIQQKLDNLKNAGTLYGRIIYQKAPVVMRQLETMIGKTEFRKGLQEYLAKFSYDNAVWDDLIEILDRDSEMDLNQWSAAWVKEAGTPEIDSKLNLASAADSKKENVLRITQTRTTPDKKYWSQQVDVKVIDENKVVFETRATIVGKVTEILLPETIADYDFYLANGSELGYGYFRLEEKSKTWLLANIQTISDDVTRGAAWMAIYESLVRGPSERSDSSIEPADFLRSLLAGVASETEPQNRQNILGQLRTVYWKFLTPQERETFAPEIESVLWKWIDAKRSEEGGESEQDNDSEQENPIVTDDARSAYYKSVVSLATTRSTIDRLYEIWESQSDVNGLPLAEADYMTLALELAVRLPGKSEHILTTQLARFENEDRRKRFDFVRPALSPDQSVRDSFFESLKEAKNRRPERWALDGLSYLHHPLRAENSEKYILPSLELLEEIQMTGDIFFPKRWLVSTFSGHRSATAAKTITKFLEDRPDYSQRLKNKILQAADLLLKVGGAPD